MTGASIKYVKQINILHEFFRTGRGSQMLSSLTGIPEGGDRRTEARGIEARGTEARGTEARGD